MARWCILIAGRPPYLPAAIAKAGGDADSADSRAWQVGAGGLDVFNGEPNLRSEYAELPNTFLLPHLGTATTETRDAMGMRALDNLDAFFGGRRAADIVVAG